MNTKDFDAFLAISGMAPQPERVDQKPQEPKASSNVFGSPIYRGESQQELTEDERRAESSDRSDIDDLTSRQNLTSAIAQAGTGLTLTIGISTTGNPALGLGIGLVGCLVFGIEATNGRKSGIVRLGAWGIGTVFAATQLWTAYSQQNAVTEVNRAVELYVIKPKQEDNQLGTWAIFAALAIAVLAALLNQKPTTSKKSDLF